MGALLQRCAIAIVARLAYVHLWSDLNSFQIEPSSQAPKDVPCLPMSESDLASRYQPIDEPMTPQRSDGSSTVNRHAANQAANQDPPAGQATRDASISIGEEEIRRRRQRIEELAELELKEKEYELRQCERKLNQKTLDFERNQMQFLDTRGDLIGTNDTPQGPRSMPFNHKHGSQSTSHLIPPSSPAPAVTSSQPRGSQSPSRSQRSSPLPAKDHAPFAAVVLVLSPSTRCQTLRPPLVTTASPGAAYSAAS